MDRASIYFLDENEKNTYAFDETLPRLPLPDLKDTLTRYYESIKPFGTEEELRQSRKSILEFENGVGSELQKKLKERASKMGNWLDEWWDSYGYHLLRFPLNPYCCMAMPLSLEVVNVTENQQVYLKNFSRIVYHTIEFWDLLRKAKIKPLSSNGGKIKYSSALYKRFFSTTRVPGIEMDFIEKHFLTVSEGKTPTHGLVSGKGRLFIFDCVHEDDSIITPQEILILFQRLRGILDYEPMGDSVPILTHDDRTSWANNRLHLKEISENNAETLKLVESANIVVVFDENEPKDAEEISQLAVNGDFHSKWGDRSSIVIGYKNGKFSCVGEHSAYDGTVSVSYAIFIQLSILEEPEPDWELVDNVKYLPLKELRFDLDEHIKAEIDRMFQVCDKMRTDVIITYTFFDDYGKEFIKNHKLHPDSFVQVIMQWAYLQMHNEIAPTYETALMRHFYNGRTETLRSCTKEVYKFLKLAEDPKATKEDIVKAFRMAVSDHNFMMAEARKGHGVDRHLFGLWCIAYENKMEIPDFYSDALYTKSGGGGNFVLSTSTLGYTSNVGYVAPMMLDGYGVFYTITSNTIYIITTAYRDSIKTSAHKFNEIFKKSFQKIKGLLESTQTSKM